MASFELKKTYNFSVKTDAATILDAKYENMKVIALMNNEEAAKKSSDINTTYTTLKGAISDLPESIVDLTFIMFKKTDDTTVILALEYIDTDTIVEVEGVNIRLNVLNANTEDISIINQAIQELGYTNFTIETFE